MLLSEPFISPKPNIMDPRQTKPTCDVYQIVTDRIIALLEQGTVPWRQPWADAGIPRNVVSKKPYNGINVLLLASLGYERNLFLTFNQVKSLGGKVKPRSRSHVVVFVKRVTMEDIESGEPKQISLLRYYPVFNVAQCEDLPAKMLPVHLPNKSPIRSCERILKNMPSCPLIEEANEGAYYNRKHDYIMMPPKKAFGSVQQYYATLFHELVHSTGSEKRLNRKELIESKEKGGEHYSIEELVAEIGACYLKSFAGIGNEPLDNHAAYIANWLTRLKGDKKFVIYASGLAQKAVDYILNRPLPTPQTLSHESTEAKA